MRNALSDYNKYVDPVTGILANAQISIGVQSGLLASARAIRDGVAQTFTSYTGYLSSDNPAVLPDLSGPANSAAPYQVILSAYGDAKAKFDDATTNLENREEDIRGANIDIKDLTTKISILANQRGELQKLIPGKEENIDSLNNIMIAKASDESRIQGEYDQLVNNGSPQPQTSNKLSELNKAKNDHDNAKKNYDAAVLDKTQTEDQITFLLGEENQKQIDKQAIVDSLPGLEQARANASTNKDNAQGELQTALSSKDAAKLVADQKLSDYLKVFNDWVLAKAAYDATVKTQSENAVSANNALAKFRGFYSEYQKEKDIFKASATQGAVLD